jgi:Phage derived protein Gp49-like (DUF891)
MPTEEIYTGARFQVRGWIDNGSNVVKVFLEELESNGDSDGTRLLALIIRTADHGITHNKAHIRALGDDLYEFKSPGTARIMFFYDKGQLIICAHCFTGKKGNEDKFVKRQIKKAAGIKKDYFDEKK